jgi:hypothetical protein
MVSNRPIRRLRQTEDESGLMLDLRDRWLSWQPYLQRR